MTTILGTFILALVLALFLTPLAGRLGRRFGAVDEPGGRKVHRVPTARTGGAAIFLAIFLALGAAAFSGTGVAQHLCLSPPLVGLLAGALVVFGVGLWDDFRRVDPRMKLLFQVLGASLAWLGGVRIGALVFLGEGGFGPVFSYGLTVLWFVFLINAVNLSDGLDGLAGGIAVFASAVMLVLSVLKGDVLSALLFAEIGRAHV